MDELKSKSDKGSLTLSVLLELLVAFDTIEPGILLDQLFEVRVGRPVLHWFHSFIFAESRSWCCTVIVWPCILINMGFHRGWLGHRLFDSYMKPLIEAVRGLDLRCHQYANESQNHRILDSEGASLDIKSDLRPNVGLNFSAR